MRLCPPLQLNLWFWGKRLIPTEAETNERKHCNRFKGDAMDYVDGELLPCIGGPIDGEKNPVSLLFGKLPNAGFDLKDGTKYVRDDSKRSWVVWESVPTKK
jgi:hypothetical protein